MIFRGIVADNYDPTGRGRIRVRINQSESTPIENLPWAEYCSPFGGGDNVDGAGFYFVPDIGTVVWLIREGDSENLVWLGSPFYNEYGVQNIPTEAKPSLSEPTLRVIKSNAGHRLLMDDRSANESGGSPYGIQLLEAKGGGLSITHPDAKGRGIRLGLPSSTELKMTRDGVRLSSAKSSLTFNDGLSALLLTNDTSSFGFQDGKATIQAPSSFYLQTATSEVTSRKGFKIDASGGPFRVDTAQAKIVSGGDVILQGGGSFNANANQFNFTGQLGSNFRIDLPIPGLPSLDQGHIVLNTAGGTILLRDGLLPPAAIPVTNLALNDPLAGTIGGRIGIEFLTGNAIFEGRLGGIFISGVPLALPGTGTVLPRTPLSPITPAPLIPPITPPLSPTTNPYVPAVGPQPAVLGNALVYTLLRVLNNFNNLLTQLLLPLGTTAVGPVVTTPTLLTQVTVCQTEVLQMITQLQTPGTGVLSPITFHE